jgi:hypothetical protein
MSDPTPAAPSVNDRATTFQAVEGPQPEHYSGEVLLVSAYAAVFVILIAWVALTWRKAGSMDERLTALEREIDKAADTPLASKRDPRDRATTSNPP